MQNLPNKAACNVCTCDHKAPRMFTFTSPGFVKTTAVRLKARGLSATETIDWALEEVLDHHQGQLTGPDGKIVEFDTNDPSEVDRFDSAFREDSRRFINHIKAKARKDWVGKYRLQTRMIYAMTLLWSALEIHDCCTCGSCSRNSE